MKRIFVILLALGHGLSASAQVFSEAGEYNDFEVNDVIDISCLSHFDFGFNGLFSGKSDADYADHTAFFQSQKFGFNMIELVIKPFRGFAFTLGADVNWNWYHVNKDFFWMPYEPTPGLIAPRENGTHVLIASKEYYGFKEIKKSELSVCTFSFPIDLNFQAHKFTLTLGASPELNLKGRTRFKGVQHDGTVVREYKSGARRSNAIATNFFTYNIHAALSYGGLGVFGMYRPGAQFQEEYGPQFQTWTVGLILGLGI